MVRINNDSNVFTYGLIGVLFSIFFLIYFPTFSLLHEYWSGAYNAYSHGYMVLAITLYLLFSTRKKIFLLKQTTSTLIFSISFLMITMISLLWFLAFSTQIQVIQIFSVILMIWLWIAVVFGQSSAYHALLPVGLLLMAIPLWDIVAPYLQGMTVVVTQLWLSWFGVTAFIEGNFIELSDGVMVVSEGCSGLKFFLAGTTLSIIYAEMNFNSIKRKIYIVVLGVVISIIANWIRVFSLVYIGDYTKMQSSLVHDHNNFGWVVFTVCFAIFLLIAYRVGPGFKLHTKDQAVKSSNVGQVRLIDSNFVKALSITLIISILPIISWSVIDSSRTVSLTHQLQLQSATKVLKASWIPNYSGFDEINSWKIIIKSREVEVSILSYKSQKQGKELIYYANTLSESEFDGKLIPGIGPTRGKSFNRSILSNKSKKILVGWYYKIGNYESKNKYLAKLMQVLSIIQGVPVASLVSIHVICESHDCVIEQQVISSAEIEKLIPLIRVNSILGSSG